MSLTRYSILILCWAVMGALSRPLLPGLFWFTTAVLPLFVLVKSERPFLRSRTGRQILAICGALLVIHATWAVIRANYYTASIPETYWLDDHFYYTQSIDISEAWKSGSYPPIWQKGSPPYLGTLHTGYHRAISTLFLIFGPSTLAPLLLNALCAAFMPLLVALTARFLWDDGKQKETALTAAWLTALHPAQFYWAAYMMKDMFTTFVFMVCMALLLGLFRRKDITMIAGSLCLLPYLFTIRVYAALSIIIGAALVPALRLRRNTILAIAAIFAITMVLLCSYTFYGNRIYQQVMSSFLALAPAQASSPLDILRQIVTGIPRLFLSPYAWLFYDSPSPMYGMYPGMWYMYLTVYPLAFAGLAAALRRNITLAVIPITAFGLAALIFLVATYEGNASRQRYYLEYLFILFASYGLRYPSKWWIGGILIAEIAFMIGQLISLR